METADSKKEKVYKCACFTSLHGDTKCWKIGLFTVFPGIIVCVTQWVLLRGLWNADRTLSDIYDKIEHSEQKADFLQKSR